MVENLPASAGGTGSIPGLETSPGERKIYPLPYSGLENSINCIAHGVAKSQTRLSDIHFHNPSGTTHATGASISCTVNIS